MKKLLRVLAVFLMILMSSVAFAKTSTEFYNINDPAHIGLGGLTSGFNYEQVCNIHGEPTKANPPKYIVPRILKEMCCSRNPITKCMPTMVKRSNYRLSC